MSTMFRSLASYNYRLWFIGALVSGAGMWMQTTAQSWVVLTELSDGDASAVGITMALQFAPQLLLVPVTGWVADRFDRRKLLLVTQILLALLAGAVGFMLLSGVMTLPLMYVLAAALGVLTAFDNPARQAFVSDLVAYQNMSNAVALNAASFNLARLVGPALAGVLIVAVGTGWVFLINAASFLVLIAVLVLIRVRELNPRTPFGRATGLADGFRYVAGRSDLMVTFLLVFAVGAIAMNFPIIASTMALEFGEGADGFGLMNTFLAIGSLFGALLTARRPKARIRVAMWAAVLYAVAAGASAFMPSYWLYVSTLAFTGFAVVTIFATSNGVVQTTSAPEVRGRVLALYMAMSMGGTAAGAPVIGFIAAHGGPRTAIVAGAAVVFLVFLVMVGWLFATGRVTRRAGYRFRLKLDDGPRVPTEYTASPKEAAAAAAAPAVASSTPASPSASAPMPASAPAAVSPQVPREGALAGAED